MHISESQQEFFRMLDEKIEKVRSYKVNICFDPGFPALWGGKVGSAATSVSYTYFSKGFEQVH